ncbi:uncharacterized protein V1518DRAFT_412789 [Limtongia smithiae]|uniref:uncharacterized protein n=1 Tax=Limtongia smithiae TaxID=1125753 RepID=UPI0034CE496E
MARKAATAKDTKKTMASTKTAKEKAKATKSVTGKRSKYFGGDDDGEDVEDVQESEYADDASGGDSYDLDDASEEARSDDDEDDEFDESEEEKPARKKLNAKGKGSPSATKRKAPGTTKSAAKKKKSITSDGASDDDAFDAREYFTPRARALSDNGIPRTLSSLHPNTFTFLAGLRANNERTWFWDHEADYRAAKSDFDSFVEVLGERIMEIDETVPHLPLKDVVFRIYRDIRFTNDKTPYKPYLSAAFSRTGRSGYYAHYYVHIEPGACHLGAGVWHLASCNPQGLQALRRHIDRGGKRLKGILQSPEMRKAVFHGVEEGESVLQQFARMNQDDALKTNPRGYAKDHKDIILLKLRTFAVHRTLSDDVFAPGREPIDTIIDIFKGVVPFVHFLNSITMDNEDSEISDAEADEAATA